MLDKTDCEHTKWTKRGFSPSGKQRWQCTQCKITTTTNPVGRPEINGEPCPKCEGNSKKNGLLRGKQKHVCKDCGYAWVTAIANKK